MIDELRNEIAKLLAEDAALKIQQQKIKMVRLALQEKISEASGKLNILAKLGELTEDDKRGLAQILGMPTIPSEETMHAPQSK